MSRLIGSSVFLSFQLKQHRILDALEIIRKRKVARAFVVEVFFNAGIVPADKVNAACSCLQAIADCVSIEVAAGLDKHPSCVLDRRLC